MGYYKDLAIDGLTRSLPAQHVPTPTEIGGSEERIGDHRVVYGDGIVAYFARSGEAYRAARRLRARGMRVRSEYWHHIEQQWIG